MKRLVVFDLDGTLAASKQAIDPEMGGLLSELLNVRMVAVISGGDWPQFEQQLLAHLPPSSPLTDLFLMPTSGTKLYRFRDGWKQIYAENFRADESKRITDAINEAVAESSLDGDVVWGEKIEDRGSQITFSGLGQQAPVDAKAKWDPDLKKRTRLKEMLEARLPNVGVHIGGSTSIDITRPGIDKAYGIGKLTGITGLSRDEMLFVGDALYPGGNDAPVRDAGVATIAVRDPAETKVVIQTILQIFNKRD